jgi:hypothetical protein
LQRARRSLSGRSFACRGDRADGQGQPPLSAPGGMQLARRSYRSYPLSTFDLWPPARLAHPDQLSQIDHRRSVPLTTMSISRPPRREHRSRSRQSSTAVRSPYRRACSAGSGSTARNPVVRRSCRMPVSALAPKELKPFREREPSWRRQSPSRSGSLSSGYRWFESISLQQTVCLSPAVAFEGREPGFPRGFGQLAWRPGQQRLAGCFDIASTGGNISVGPYSSTAVRLVVAPGLTRGRSVDL